MTVDRPATEPRTEAGLDLLRRGAAFNGGKHMSITLRADDWVPAILAIEAEARMIGKEEGIRATLEEWKKDREAAQGAAPLDFDIDRIPHTCMNEDVDEDRCPRCSIDEGAAPEPICPVAKHRTDNTPNRCTLPWLHGGDHAFEDEGAAPRAEGLDVERMRQALGANGWYIANVLDASWVESSEWGPILSRPSEERES